MVDMLTLKEDVMKPLNRMDIFYAGSVAKLAEYQERGADEYHRSVATQCRL